MRSWLVPTRWTVPLLRASGRLVVSRITRRGLPRPGGAFLDAARVGEDNGALLHKIDKLQVLQRLNEEEVLVGRQVFAKHLVDGLTHVRVEVHGIDKVHIRVLLGEVFHGGDH